MAASGVGGMTLLKSAMPVVCADSRKQKTKPMNKYSTFGLRGWKTGWPSKSDFYIVKAFKQPDYSIAEYLYEGVIRHDRSWNIDYSNSIVLKSFFDGQNFQDIPEGFLVDEWLAAFL